MHNDKLTITYGRRLDIRHQVDILVVGGGPAGIATALAASRQGAVVRLIEAHSCLGGMGTAGMVPAFMQFTDGVNFLAGGIGQEILAALQEADGSVPPDSMGIRETRRIVGDYVLNIEDFKCLAVFDDEIGRYSYPVDIHIAKPDRESYDKFCKEYSTLRLGKGESYGIPYRILTPQGLKNVLVSGRCVSTDRNVQSSIRVMPGCYITGQAAGVAAAMAVQAEVDTRGIDIRALQVKLKAMGAYLPNSGKS